MSGECEKCGEHALECVCNIVTKVPCGYDINIKNKENYEKLTIDFDRLDFKVITIIRDGKEISFSTCEFWQIFGSKHKEFR